MMRVFPIRISTTYANPLLAIEAAMTLVKQQRPGLQPTAAEAVDGSVPQLGRMPPMPGYVVEVFHHDLHTSGVTHELGGRLRLVDLLNSDDPTFDLREATVDLVGRLRQHENLTLIKSSILVAVPRETPEQIREMLMGRMLYGRAARQAIQLAIAMPGLSIEGTGYVSTGAGTIRLATFEPFFPMTSCAIETDKYGRIDTPVALVNRDAIAALQCRVAPDTKN
jgi:hypothetical protein